MKPPPPPKATPPRHVVPDPDYIADLEQSEGEAAIRKRMKQRERGQPINRPKGLQP